jgi:hypothetical protein
VTRSLDSFISYHLPVSPPNHQQLEVSLYYCYNYNLVTMASVEKKETLVQVDTAPSTPAPKTPERMHLAIPKHSFDSPLSQVPTPHSEYDSPSSHPLSAFYSHPTTRTSLEQLKCNSTSQLKVYETDVESGSKRFSMEPVNSRGTPQKDCKVWPQKSTLMRQKLEWKKKRGCAPWNTLSKKQKLIAKIIIMLLVCGLVVGVAVGISRAVGGTVYHDEDHSRPIDK